MAEETTVHRVLADASRVRILSLLEAAGRPLGVSELAQATGLHANTVRGHLALLEETGFVVSHAEPRARPGRPRHVYEWVPRTAEHEHALLAAALASSLDPLPDGPALAEASGRSWGRLLTPPLREGAEPTEDAAVSRVSALLAERGFAPVVRGRRLVMRRCPFEELARRYPHIVCTLHRGLIEGALERVGSPVGVERLEPWASPDGCVARLGERVESRGQGEGEGDSSSGTSTT